MGDAYLFSYRSFSTNCNQPVQSLAWISDNYLLTIRKRNCGKYYAVAYDSSTGKLIYRLVQVEPLCITAYRTNSHDNSRFATLCGVADQGSAFLWRPFKHSIGIQSLYSKTNIKCTNQVFITAENTVLVLCDDYKRACLVTDTLFRGFAIQNAASDNDSDSSVGKRSLSRRNSTSSLTKSKASTTIARTNASPNRSGVVQVVATAFDECASRLAIVSHTAARCNIIEILIGLFDFDPADNESDPSWSRYELNVLDDQVGFSDSESQLDPLYDIIIALRSFQLVIFANLTASSRVLIICQLPAFDSDAALNKLTVLRVVRFPVVSFSNYPSEFNSFVFLENENVVQLCICDLDAAINNRKATFAASNRRLTSATDASSSIAKQRLSIERSVIIAMTTFGALFILDSDGKEVRLHASIDNDGSKSTQQGLDATSVGYRPFQFVSSSISLANLSPRNSAASTITKQTFSFALRHVDTHRLKVDDSQTVEQAHSVPLFDPTVSLFKLALSDGFTVQSYLLVLPTLTALLETAPNNRVGLQGVLDAKQRYQVAERERETKVSLRFPRIEDDEGDAFSDTESPRSLLSSDAVKSLANGSFNIVLQGLLLRRECASERPDVDLELDFALRLLNLVLSSFYCAEHRCVPDVFVAAQRALEFALARTGECLLRKHAAEHDHVHDSCVSAIHDRLEQLLTAFWNFDRHFRCFDASLVVFVRDLLRLFDCDAVQRAGSDLFDRFYTRTYTFKLDGDMHLLRLRFGAGLAASDMVVSVLDYSVPRRVASIDECDSPASACSFTQMISNLHDFLSSCLHARQLCDALTVFCRELVQRCELINLLTFVYALNDARFDGNESLRWLRSLRAVLQSDSCYDSVRDLRRKCGALFGEDDCDVICTQLLIAATRTLAVLLMSMFVRQQVIDCFFDAQRAEECTLKRYVVLQLGPSSASLNPNRLADASRFVEFKSSKLGQLVCEPQACLDLLLSLDLLEDSITFCLLHSDFVSALKLAMWQSQESSSANSKRSRNRKMAARLLMTLIKRQLKNWANTHDDLNEQSVVDFLQCADTLLELCARQRGVHSIYLSVERGLLRKIIGVAKQYFAPAVCPVDSQTIARRFFFTHASLPLPAAPLYVSQSASATQSNSVESGLRSSLAKLIRIFLLSLHAHSVTINDQQMTALRAFSSLYLRMLRNVHARNVTELSVMPLLAGQRSAYEQRAVSVSRQSSAGFDEQTATFDRDEFKLFRSFLSLLWFMTVRDRLSFVYHEAMFAQSSEAEAMGERDDRVRERIGLLERIYPFLCAFSDPLAASDSSETEWKTEELFQLLLLNAFAQLSEHKWDTALRLAFYFPVCEETRRSTAVQNRLNTFVTSLQNCKLDSDFPLQLQLCQPNSLKSGQTLSLAYRVLRTGLHHEVADKWRLLIGEFREFDRFSDAVSELTRPMRSEQEPTVSAFVAQSGENDMHVVESDCAIGCKLFELDSDFHSFLETFQSITGASFSQLRRENLASVSAFASGGSIGEPAGAELYELFEFLKFDFVFSDLTEKELKTLFDGACDSQHSISVCELADQLVKCVYKFNIPHLATQTKI